MKDAAILIIDDNKSILSALELLLKYKCANLQTFSSPDHGFNAFQGKHYDVVLLDMNFRAGVNTGNEGLYWLDKFLSLKPEASIVMMTAYGGIDLAVNAIKKGAIDFVLKPWENEKLLATLQSAINLGRSRQEVSRLKRKEQELIQVMNKNDRSIIGESAAIQSVIRMIEKVAVTDANVLITGENGTGKELIAREIHQRSKRHQKLLVTVDMGAIPEALFESELFGHKKGAFTDAKEDRAGKFEMASGGTLFLDEIGNLPLTAQAKLLTVLQNRTITRVGGNTPVPIDIRLISATNCRLQQMVHDDLFREDLLYRLNTITIEAPPLRDRIGDIPLLARFFLQKYADKYHKKGLKISASALTKLEKHNWPGNIRELQHTIEKAVILADTQELTTSDFVFKNARNTESNQSNGTLQDMEISLIQMELDKCAGNLSAAASNLGITRQTLYNKIKKYGL